MLNAIKSQTSSIAAGTRYDINKLLERFNEYSNDKRIKRQKLSQMMPWEVLKDFSKASYTFDQILHLLGEHEGSSEPSVYVISFVRLLVSYRDRCMKEDKLDQAAEIQKQLRDICQAQVEREKLRLQKDYHNIYGELYLSQQKQLEQFEQEWANYLEKFEMQKQKKLQESHKTRQKQLVKERQRVVSSLGKHSVLASPRLNDLQTKKMWLMRDHRYDQAIELNRQIKDQRSRLINKRSTKFQFILDKTIKNYTNRKTKSIDYIQSSLQNNLHQLIAKKNQGAAIMRVKMKSLRQEAQRKLTFHFNNQINKIQAILTNLCNK